MQKGVYGYNTQLKIEKAFGNGEILWSKKRMGYPQEAENAYTEAVRKYTDKVCTIIEKELPALKNDYHAMLESTTDRADASDISTGQAESLLQGVRDKLSNALLTTYLASTIHKAAGAMKKQTVSEWSKSVDRTFGLKVDEDYYTDDFFEDEAKGWEEYNNNHFPELTELLLGTILLCIANAIDSQTPEDDLLTNIQAAESQYQNHADFVTADQSIKLNASYNRKIYQDAGIDRYVWQTMEDSRVRESHRELDGHVFSFDDPPQIDSEPMNPGDDYGCRCMAEPVYDITSFSIPLVDEADDMGAFNSDGNDNLFRNVNQMKWARARTRYGKRS